MKIRKIILLTIVSLFVITSASLILFHQKYFNKVVYKTNCSYALPLGWHLIDTNGSYTLQGDYYSGTFYMKQPMPAFFSPYGSYEERTVFMDSCNAKGTFEQFRNDYFKTKYQRSEPVDTSFTNEMKRSSERLNRSLHYVSMCNKLQNEIIDAYQEDNPSKASRKIKLYNKYVDSLHKN